MKTNREIGEARKLETSAPPSTIKTSLFCIVLGVIIFCTGCLSTGKSKSKIIVDMPEVFTRERLVNERLREKNWLENKLKEKYVWSFQGYRDVRLFKGFAAQGNPQQLVPQADAEHGHMSHKLPDGVDSIGHWLGIAGSV